MTNFGIFNEDEMTNALDKKFIFTLNANLKFFLKRMFGPLNPMKKVYCEKTDHYIKPDVVVTYGRERKCVSIKSGKSNNLHTEKLPTFIDFLKESGISEKTIETILLVQYGDGTLDGTGKYRADFYEIFIKYKDRIVLANHELNDKMEFIEKFFERVVFQGVDANAMGVDFIYHGDMDYGVVVSKKQILKYISSKKGTWGFYENIHVGPIVLRPHARYSHRAVICDERRHQIQCNWPNFKSDLEYIVKRFGY